MLNIAFGQSKYYVDNLSENVKRGLRQKVRRGEYPGKAPLGYVNNKATHIIEPDTEKHLLVRKLFELYASGDYSLRSVRDKITEAGLVSPSGKQLSISNTQSILQNPFYYGAFLFRNELHEGKHEPAITKKIFDQVQAVMKQKARPKKKQRYFPFRGLFICGECGCSITSERQKEHNYYRCTKKRGECSQRYLREEQLAEQVTNFVQQISIDETMANKISDYLQQQAAQDNSDALTYSEKLQKHIAATTEKLDRLLDAHLDGTVDKETYTVKKNELLNNKIQSEQELQETQAMGNRWLELSLQFISDANLAKKTALTGNYEELRNFLKKIGSNLHIRERTVGLLWRKPWELLAERACACGAGGHEFEHCTVMLGRRDSNP